MSVLQRRIASVTDTTAHLVTQLQELDQLRERVKKALLSSKRPPPRRRPNRKVAVSRAYPGRTDAKLCTAELGVPTRAP